MNKILKIRIFIGTLNSTVFVVKAEKPFKLILEWFFILRHIVLLDLPWLLLSLLKSSQLQNQYTGLTDTYLPVPALPNRQLCDLMLFKSRKISNLLIFRISISLR